VKGNGKMMKRDVVELESAFLEFCNVADRLGYKFNFGSKIELQHRSETDHCLNGRVSLDPVDFAEKD
tara:strand:- start:8 stop:208 length:201 start_codon:yes stop_codon:yes gene_type:complete